MLLFGALGGARRVVLVDARGDSREEAWAGILTRLPARLSSEAAASTKAIAKSKSRLKQLEQVAVNRAPAFSGKNGDQLRIAYLRSTPSPGSAAGGAATHINGFVNAASELGAGVRVISNDYIAGLDETKLTLVDPEPVGTTRAAFDLRNNLIFSDGVLKAIANNPVDLIYQRYGRFTWAGVEASLQARVPLFLEYNGSEVWIGKHWDMSGMIPLLERFERLNLNAKPTPYERRVRARTRPSQPASTQQRHLPAGWMAILGEAHHVHPFIQPLLPRRHLRSLCRPL